MTKPELIAIIVIRILIIAGILSAIPAIGLVVAVAKGAVAVPMFFERNKPIVATTGGAVGGVAGAVRAGPRVLGFRVVLEEARQHEIGIPGVGRAQGPQPLAKSTRRQTCEIAFGVQV
jgi:hypothetical protein